MLNDPTPEEVAEFARREAARRRGENLKNLRLAAGLKQIDLADLVGTGHTAITAAEVGRAWNPDWLVPMAEAFGMSLDQLNAALQKPAP